MGLLVAMGVGAISGQLAKKALSQQTGSVRRRRAEHRQRIGGNSSTGEKWITETTSSRMTSRA